MGKAVNGPGKGDGTTYGTLQAEEVGHCMLPYIRDQILELVNESLLVAVL